jgi:hypothetical protein
MADIIVTSEHAYFNDNVTVFKDLEVLGTLKYNFAKNPVDINGLGVNLRDLTTTGVTTFRGPVKFENTVDIIAFDDITIGIITVTNYLDVSNTLFADAVSNKVGIGSFSPEEQLDVLGNIKVTDSIKIGANIYDSVDATGANGYYLSRDVNGIRWVSLPPTLTEGIFVQNEGTLVGVGQSFKTLNFISGSNASILELVEASVNIENSEFADITIKSFWEKVGINNLSRNSRVAINTTSNPQYELDVTGSLRVTEDIFIENNLNLDGTAYILGGLDVDQTVDFSGNFLAKGSSIFSSSAVFEGRVDFYSDSFSSGRFTFGNSTTFNNTVDINSNTDISGTLQVGGAAALNSTVVILGQTTIDDRLTVTGRTNIGDITTIDGNLILKSDATGTITTSRYSLRSGISTNSDYARTSGLSTLSEYSIYSVLSGISTFSTFSGISTESLSIQTILNQDNNNYYLTFSGNPSGNTGELLYVNNGISFNPALGNLEIGKTIQVGVGGSLIKTTEENFIGFGTEIPSREFDVNKDVRLQKSLYDSSDNIGFRTENYQVPRSILSSVPVNTDGNFIGGRFFDAANMIRLNLDYIANEAVGYITSTDYKNPAFFLSTDNYISCKTDIKNILRAVTLDLTRGGNENSVGAGLSYYNGNTLIHITGTDDNGYSIQEASITAIGAASTLARYVINNFTPPKSYQSGISSVKQIKDLTLQDDPDYNSNMSELGCANVASAIHSYVGIVTTIIGNGPDSSPNLTYPQEKVVWSPAGADSKNTIWVTKYGNDENTGKTEGDAKLTIAAAAEVAEPGDTIFIRPGVYFEENPIGLRRDVSVSGQDLRLVNVIPKNLNKDVFHVRRGCLIENLSFNLENSAQETLGAAVAFPPTPEDIAAGLSYGAITGYTEPGPADEGPTGRWRSPYVRNCTNFMRRSIGMKVDGNHATGSTIGGDLKSMVLDAYTQYNEAGIGVSITNNGYAQLVSLFTIASEIAVYAASGGSCDLTNSNSSFGTYGLYADGLSVLEFDGEINVASDTESDVFSFRNVSDNVKNPRRPYDGQALYFKVPVNGVPIEEPFEQLDRVVIINGGSGYSSAAPPNVIIRDADGTVEPKGLEGIIAEVSPTIDDATGQITAIDIINTGRNYLSTQNIIVDIEGTGGAIATAVMTPIYYTVNQATVPSDPRHRYADAVNLILRNKEFIITEALDRMLAQFTTFSVPGGNEKCLSDMRLVVDAIAHNLQFGGNDRTYDAAYVYYTNSYLSGEEEQSIRAYRNMISIMWNIINNVTVAKFNYSGINVYTQYKDLSIIADPETGSNQDFNSCADVKSAIDTLVGIVTSAINVAAPILPANRTIGNTVGLTTVTLNEFVPYPVGVGVSVEMFRISRILTSGHAFEYIGSGTDINTSTPQKGAVPIKENEVIAINGAQIPYTSTDQQGNFNIGDGIQINQVTASISGRDFNRAIQAQVTPLILALR